MAITNLEELRELLEGATITKIDKSTQVESLFDLAFVKDGSECEATLYATELGWWVDRILKKEEDGKIIAEDTDFFCLVSDHLKELLSSDPSLSDNPLQPVWDSDTCEIHCKVTGREWRFQDGGNHAFVDFTDTKDGLEAFTELLWLHHQDKDIAPATYSDYREGWAWMLWHI